jgi:hypothetical protein
MQVNKRDTHNPIITKIDDIVMQESEKLLTALEDAVDLYAGLIEIQRDRTIQSTDASFPISLAKLGELQLQALKQKNDVLKNLTSYKSAETSGQRKGPGELSISDLLNSAALGAGVGAKLNMSGQTVQPRLINEDGEQDLITVQIENMNTTMPSPESAAETLLRDFK